jgi:transcriptional regulator with XRE-family HTH domain
METGFSRFVKQHRVQRNWSLAELARRSGLTQPEVSRLETCKRTPTLRHVRGLAEAFTDVPTPGSVPLVIEMSGNLQVNEPERYEEWISILVELGERSRVQKRAKT